MKLGEILIQSHSVASQDIDRALKFQATYGGRIGTILVNMGIISEDTLIRALARQLDIPLLPDFFEDDPDFVFPETAGELNLSFLIRRKWLPFKEVDHLLHIAATDPMDAEILQYLKDMGIEWQLFLVTETRFREMQKCL